MIVQIQIRAKIMTVDKTYSIKALLASFSSALLVFTDESKDSRRDCDRLFARDERCFKLTDNSSESSASCRTISVLLQRNQKLIDLL